MSDRTITEKSALQVGTEITWQRHSPRPRLVTGVCIGARRSPGVTMTTDDGVFPAVQFLIEQADGKRVWTDNFADKP